MGAQAEVLWLVQHPEFRQRPATVREFCGPDYLNDPRIRPGVLDALVDTFGEEINPRSISNIRESMMTGGIGIGKSTYASIALAYMVHWVQCLKDPQQFFGLMVGSKIGFMMMSTSMKQAQEVIFDKVKARIKSCAWFAKWSPLDEDSKGMTRQLRFARGIWVVPGTSEETSFEGYDILGGIIDEGDSHKVTDRKSYAAEGFSTIESRISSRYTDFESGDHLGLIILIGQMKSKSGFMAKMEKKFASSPRSTVVKMKLWESYGWHNFTLDKGDIKRGRETAPRDSFYFDTMRKLTLTKEEGEAKLSKHLIEVPNTYKNQFVDDPVKALRDLAGIPPDAEDPFMPQVDRIEACQDAWHARTGRAQYEMELNFDPGKHRLPDWLKAHDDLPRAVHIDTAYSGDGDALGLAMGHIPEKVLVGEEERPVVFFDLVLRIKARSGTEIQLALIREIIYYLRDELGYNIDVVTMDGFNTTDFMQQLRRSRVRCEYQSIDKTKAAYEDLRELVNSVRALFPVYMVLIRPTDTKPVDIVNKELVELEDTGRKIDHPISGSKDVADCLAGVAHTLTTVNKYIRAARTVDGEGAAKSEDSGVTSLEDLFSGATPPVPDGHVASFEEFQRNTEGYMKQAGVPSIDYDFLTAQGRNPLMPDRRML